MSLNVPPTSLTYIYIYICIYIYIYIYNGFKKQEFLTGIRTNSNSLLPRNCNCRQNDLQSYPLKIFSDGTHKTLEYTSDNLTNRLKYLYSYQALRSSRIRHNVDVFKADFYKFEFRVFLLLDWLSYWNKWLSLLNYLPISGIRLVGFRLFPMV